MEVWIDSTGLREAHRTHHREAQNYGREMLRGLLESGRDHDYRFVGWPTSELGSVERYLAPLSREVRSRLSQPQGSRGPWALYSPIGFPCLDDRNLRGLRLDPPTLRVATLLEERPRPLEAKAATVVMLTRTALEALASRSPGSGWDLRWVPPGLGAARPSRVESRHIPVPEGDYILASGAHAADPPESMAAVWRLLRAFRTVRRTHGKRARLVFLGGAPLPLRQAAACLGLAKEVSFISQGFDDEFTRQRLIASATLFVHVTRPDSSWLLGAEAMRSGVPVLAPRTASAQEVWGEAAVYFAEGSALEISRGLDRLLSSAELRRSLASHGIARGQSFTWEAAANRLLDCLSERAGESVGKRWLSGPLPSSPVATTA